MKFSSNRFSMLMTTAVLSTAVVLSCFAGCNGRANPDVVPGGGILTANGKPMNNVEIRFIPTQEGLDGNFIAKGVSDENGKFVLSFPGEDGSGVVVGENKVILLEGPMPEGARGQSEESQKEAVAFARGLKFRPIPRHYSSLSESPLSFSVTADKSEFEIDIETR